MDPDQQGERREYGQDIGAELESDAEKNALVLLETDLPPELYAGYLPWLAAGGIVLAAAGIASGRCAAGAPPPH